MPKISVIIPVYNVEATLRRCVDSVLRQTLTDHEIILVDDGSPDRCDEICDEYERQHECITVIHQENSGVSAARNAGLAIAKGEYVMFLDSDDLLNDDCLEILARSDADMIVGLYTWYEADASTIKSRSVSRQPELITKEQFAEKIPFLLNSSRLNYIHGKLFKRSVIVENGLSFEDYRLMLAEDTVFNLIFLKYCGSVYLAEEYVHRYICGTGTLSSRFYPDNFERGRRFCDFLENTARELSIETEEMRHVLSRRRVRAATYALNGMVHAKKPDREFRTQFAETVYSDEKLRDAYHSLSDDELSEPVYKELVFLLENGVDKFMTNLYQRYRTNRWQLARHAVYVKLKTMRILK